MNRRTGAGVRTAHDRGLFALVAVAVAAGVPLTVAAQAEPYESASREQYGSGLGQIPLPAGLTFAPRADAAVQYVANLKLAEDGDPQVDMAGLEAAPGVYAAYSSERATAALDYALIARAWEDSDYNDISHRLSANGNWVAAPGWFYVRAGAGYRDDIIDPAVSGNYGRLGVFGGSNIAEVLTASVSPVLQHDFGALELLASYSYGRLWHFDVPEEYEGLGRQDSVDQGARLALGTSDRARPYGFTAAYDWQQTEYKGAIAPYEYERVGLDTHWLIGRGVSLVAEAGLESDLTQNISAGGLEEDYWNAGLRWAPDERTTAEARYGQRFFGDSYSLLLRRQQRVLEFQAEYGEDPEVRTRRQSLSEFTPGVLPPVDSGGDYIGNAGQPYVRKSVRVSVAANGSRTRLRLGANRDERDYLAGNIGDDVRTHFQFTARRDLASNLWAEFDARYGEFERTQFNPEPEPPTVTDRADREFIVRMEREMGRALTATAETGYLSSTGSQEYDGWWVAVRLRYEP